jgi:predicted Zn-dependent protease
MTRLTEQLLDAFLLVVLGYFIGVWLVVLLEVLSIWF